MEFPEWISRNVLLHQCWPCMFFELRQGHFEVNSFFCRWIHGVLVRFFIFGPGENGSICGKGPSDVFTFSTQICHLSASLFNGFPWCALILIKMVSSPWSIRSRTGCMISLIMSASGFPHIDGDLLSQFLGWGEEVCWVLQEDIWFSLISLPCIF